MCLVLKTPAWTELSPLPAHVKAQKAIVSIDILRKDLPSAWHKVGPTVDFLSLHRPQRWAPKALVLSSGSDPWGKWL